jgi:prolyl-tRNA synthetase
MELGHIFYYDTKYSEKLNAKFVSKDNTQVYYYGGCYGIGVSRIMGMLSMQDFWPLSVSPFSVFLVYVNDSQKEKATELYDFLLSKNIEVLYDDRDGVSFGEKMRDKSLIGIPLGIIIGKEFLEFYDRSEKTELNSFEHILTLIKKKITENI